MAPVGSSLVVPAPVHRVFEFVARPKSFSVMWPAMDEVWDEQPSPRGGLDWRWQYHMLGVGLSGTTTVLEFDPPTAITMISQGSGLTVEHAWSFRPVPEGTQLGLVMDFILPAQWLTGFMERLVVRENRHQMAVALRNLKEALAGPPGLALAG